MDGARVGLEINRKNQNGLGWYQNLVISPGVFSALASFENVHKAPSHLVSSQFSLNTF